MRNKRIIIPFNGHDRRCNCRLPISATHNITNSIHLGSQIKIKDNCPSFLHRLQTRHVVKRCQNQPKNCFGVSTCRTAFNTCLNPITVVSLFNHTKCALTFFIQSFIAKCKAKEKNKKVKMQSMKETAANMAASAKAGMEKTKATMQEKMDKISAHDPMEKDLATQRKEERIQNAELNKQEAREHNAVARQSTKTGGHNPGYTATGTGAYTAAGPGTGTGYGSTEPGTGYGSSGPGADYRSSGPGGEYGTGRGYGSSGPGTGTGYGSGGPGSGTESYSYSTSGAYGNPTGGEQMSALPGHGSGQPTGRVTEGLVGSHPIGRNTGTGHNLSHNTRVEGTDGSAYGTGGPYT